MSPAGRGGRRAGAVLLLLLAIAPASHAQNSFAEDTWRNAPAGPSPAAAPPASAPAGPAGIRAPYPPAPRTVPAGEAAPGRFADAARVEAEDFGVAPTDQLRAGAMHAPTPTTIPGGAVISTAGLHQLYQQGAGKFIVFDILGGQQGLPGAQNALPAGQGGSFADQTQRDFGAYLETVTPGRKDLPLVFYCQSVYCWMSYNAALRAIRLGYTQVRWYRGGIEAWQQAGLQTHSRQQ